MNIAIITAELPYPCNSGGRIYTWERIKILNKMGHNIKLYTFIDDDEKVDNEEILKYCSEINKYKRNSSIIGNAVNILKPYSAYSRYNINLKKNIIDNIENEKIDLIIIDMPQLFYNIDFKSKVPIICTQHNIEYKTFFNIAKITSSLIKKLAFIFEGLKLKCFEKNIYENSIVDGYTFISETDMKYFTSEYMDSKAILVPMGYDTVEVKKSNKENKIVFTGKMNYQPNIEAVKWFCNNIFPKIKDEIYDAVFYIVGKLPVDEVKLLGKIEGVIVTGEVNDINEYLDTSKLVVIPLLSGGGVKIKLLEALGRGNAVVSTTKGIEGTEFVNNEHLLVTNNIEKFAHNCIEILKNPDKYYHLSVNSKELINKRYGWSYIGRNYSSFIEKIYTEKID